MKYKTLYTDGNILKGELDGTATDIKVLGNKPDNFIVEINGTKYKMYVD